jgi:hypothetical protein
MLAYFAQLVRSRSDRIRENGKHFGDGKFDELGDHLVLNKCACPKFAPLLSPIEETSGSEICAHVRDRSSYPVADISECL